MLPYNISFENIDKPSKIVLSQCSQVRYESDLSTVLRILVNDKQDIKSERPEGDCIASTEHKTKFRASKSGIEPHGDDYIPQKKYKPKYVSRTSGNEAHDGDYIPPPREYKPKYQPKT
jgi:hypothetical protein